MCGDTMDNIYINDIYEVRISKLDHFGRGIAKLRDILVFIDGACTGDICKIKITGIKKNYLTATLVEILEKSEIRKDAECPYYEICGGCHIMHINYQEQLKFKENKVKELLNRYAKVEDVNIFPIVYKNEFNYRNKVVFHGSIDELGFYVEKTNNIVNIDNCLIANNEINKIYKSILEYKDTHDTLIENIMIRVSSLGEKLVVLEGNIDNDIVDYLDVDTLYINQNKVLGNGYILEDIFGIKFKIYPSSFFQVNYDMMCVMYRIVMNYYQNKDYNTVLDLYCGTGTIGMLVSAYCRKVIGVEVEESSIKSALECSKLNNIDNISFMLGKVEDKIDSINSEQVESIIVDPPRNGLDSYTKDTIIKINPQSIVYISCDPVTLSRDLEYLLKYYDLLEVHPIDMFPNTYHVESIVILERK